MDASDTYQLIILIILLALSAFFSSNETALMAVNKIRLRTLADEGNKRAAKVLDIVENHTSKMLSAILIGNNLVNITASSLATSLAYSFGGYMVSIATAALTVAILIFGEITPKELRNIKRRKNYITLYSGSQLFYDDYDSVHLHHQSVFKNLYEASACGSGCSQ